MYTPNSIDVFCSAYAGAIGGYQKGRSPHSTITSQYVRVAEAALAFATAFDTEFAVVLPNELQLQEIETLAAEILSYPNNMTTALSPSSYVTVCDGIIAMMSEASSVIATNIPTPIPIPTPIALSVINLPTVIGGPGLYGTIPVSAVAAVVDGYHVIGDNGGGLFFWNPTSAAADNGITVVNPSGNIGNGRWIRIWTGPLQSLWSGADPSGITDALSAFQALVALLPTTGGGIEFNGGDFQLSDELVITGYDRLVLFSDEGCRFHQAKNKRGIGLVSCTNVEVYGLGLYGTIQTDGGDPGGGNNAQTGLTLSQCTNVDVHNNLFKNLGGYAANPAGSTNVKIHHNTSDQTMAGFQTNGGVGIINTNIDVSDNTLIGFIPTGGAGTIGSDDLIAFFGGLGGDIIACRNSIDKRGIDAPSMALVQGHCITIESAGVGGNIRNIIADENICLNSYSTVARGRAAIEILADPGGTPSHIHANGNLIRLCCSGIVINAGGGAFTIDDITADGNDITDVRLGVTVVPRAIAINAPAGGGPTISRVAACRNNIDGVADGTGAGISLEVATVNVSKTNGNIMRGVVGNGMFLDTSGGQWDVEQNDVNGCGANGIVVISSGAGGRSRLIGNHSNGNGAEGFNLQSLTGLTLIGNESKGNGADGFYVQSVSNARVIGNEATANGAAGLKTVTNVTTFFCLGNDFHGNTGYGIDYGGTNNIAEFVANGLLGNLAAFNDASITSTTKYLANPDLLKSIALAGILAPTAGESPVVTPAGIWLNAGIATGADLASGSQTITAAQGGMRWMRAATMLANSDVHLSVAGPPRTGFVMGITDLDTTAHTLAVINDGPAAGTLLTFAASEHGTAYFRFNGTDWEFSTFQPVVTDA